MAHKKEEGTYHCNEKCLDSSAQGKACLSSYLLTIQDLIRARGFLTDPKQHTRSLLLNASWHWSSLKLISTELVMPFNHFILCHPLLLLPSIFLSIRVFSNMSTLCVSWPKYQSFSFNISPSSEHPGLISFRMDWLDLLAVQGTLKSLVQHHSSNSLALSFLYSPTFTSILEYWKNHSLD